MKLGLPILAILFLAAGSTFCMAKQTTLSTVPVFGDVNVSAVCYFSDISASPINYTISIISGDGTVVSTDSATVQPGHSIFLGIAATGDLYRCSFVFAGKEKNVRGGMSFYSGSSNQAFVVVPAN